MQFDIEEFIRLFGSEKASRVLSTLGRKEERYNNLMREEVQPVLFETIKKWEHLLVKIVRGDANDRERQQFEIFDEFLIDYAKKIVDYRKELVSVIQDMEKSQAKRKR